MVTTPHRRTIAALAGTAATLATPLAHAHMGLGAPHAHLGEAAMLLDSFTRGALHPLTGLDHLLAMLTVGAWSALTLSGTAPRAGAEAPQQATDAAANGKAGAWSLIAAPLAFAVALLMGALAALAGVHAPGVEPMVAASVLVLGLALATRWSAGRAAAVAVIGLFAFCHGLAHGAELGAFASGNSGNMGVPAAGLAGMVLGTAALHGMGIALAWPLRALTRSTSRRVSRWAGAAVALTGTGLLLAPAVAALPAALG